MVTGSMFHVERPCRHRSRNHWAVEHLVGWIGGWRPLRSPGADASRIRTTGARLGLTRPIIPSPGRLRWGGV